MRLGLWMARGSVGSGLRGSLRLALGAKLGGKLWITKLAAVANQPSAQGTFAFPTLGAGESGLHLCEFLRGDAHKVRRLAAISAINCFLNAFTTAVILGVSLICFPASIFRRLRVVHEF